MVRTLIYVAALAVVSAVAVWVVEHPGTVSLHWRNYLIESSLAMLVLGVVVLAALIAALYHMLRWFYIGPRRLRAARAIRRRQRGYRALSHGLAAAAAGDPEAARRAARVAEGLLGEPPLTLLLTAQAAQLEGDETAAATAFRMMLDSPETEFLGLRGLLVQAVRKGDTDTALTLARRAFEISPRTGWVLSNLVDLEIAAGNWEEAERSVEAAVNARRLDSGQGRRRRALLFHQRAVAADRAGRAGQAADLARKALALAPGFVPAALLSARLAIGSGRHRHARKAIERCWAAAPHPDLALAYLDTLETADPLSRVKALAPLLKPDGSVEGHIAIAEAALGAQLWGTAREHLGQAARRGPTARLCRLMATLEEAENGDADAARQWLLRASDAPPDPAWVCAGCGAPTPEWTLYCGACNAFDSLRWRAPASIALAREQAVLILTDEVAPAQDEAKTPIDA